MIFPSRELGKPPRENIIAKLATANLFHTNINVASMIMSWTNQQIVIQLLDNNTFIQCERSAVKLEGFEPTALWLQVM